MPGLPLETPLLSRSSHCLTASLTCLLALAALCSWEPWTPYLLGPWLLHPPSVTSSGPLKQPNQTQPAMLLTPDPTPAWARTLSPVLGAMRHRVPARAVLTGV